jgi:hypothetical protein
MCGYPFSCSSSPFHDTIAWFITKHLHGDRLKDNPSSFNTALAAAAAAALTLRETEILYPWRVIRMTTCIHYTLILMIHLRWRRTKREMNTKNGEDQRVPNSPFRPDAARVRYRDQHFFFCFFVFFWGFQLNIIRCVLLFWIHC